MAYFNKGITYLKLNNKKEAKLYIDTALSLNKTDESIFFARALLKKELGDFKGAMKDYDAALLLDPNYKNALFNRAYTKKTLGDYNSAINDISNLLNQDGENPEYWNSLGNVQMIYGEYFEAKKSYSKAIDLDMDYLDARFNRGLAHIFSNQSGLGCEDLQYCIDKDYGENAENIFTDFCGF